MKIVVCIPARYDSTRFPGKVLAQDTGKYLIQHTYERASKASLPQSVLIAADDERVVRAAESFGVPCVLTRADHQSGTDRIAEAVAGLDADIVVNVQGDEPEIDPDHIDLLARLLVENPDVPMATLATPLRLAEQVADPNVVKVVVSSRTSPVGANSRGCPCGTGQAQGPAPTRDAAARAIYFSRSPIPYDRDRGGIGPAGHYLRHIGIYAYRREFLLQLAALPQTPLEKTEKLEQLRVIENGHAILVGTVEHTAEGIDTPQQYAAFVQRYRKQDVNDPAHNTPASQGQDSNG
ncbi:3-deoxy-manno-octulosonate cytidylyltransferase [Anaerobaca lacustris]|uniref:3-deoxy-manno-octulosonate cytidylyltransferase n=1 Tax=Anaerobaca lacustris TaxID=3044600 RepID=A0AAW6TYM1_9BACT|nr:3-deoxy-manno-octulosonate cytidylyltransferase [Sedimentisphaerales bacterium M17dextr]